MTKVLFLLSAVVMVVAGFFSFQNRETFLKARKDRSEALVKLTSEMDKVVKINKSIDDVRIKINATNTDVSNSNELLNVAKVKLKNITEEAARLEKEVADKQGEITKIRAKITKLPANMTLETMNEDVNKLKQSIADSESQVVKLEEQVVAKDGEVKKVEAKRDGVIERIESRKKLFDRNSMSATIVAVNNDWGFVVIDGGQNKGITVDTKLIVTRGQDTIGRLNIIGVDGNKTVANIDQKSMRPGLAVAPGDRVILETLFQ